MQAFRLYSIEDFELNMILFTVLIFTDVESVSSTRVFGIRQSLSVGTQHIAAGTLEATDLVISLDPNLLSTNAHPVLPSLAR